jgi:hypothetical protein
MCNLETVPLRSNGEMESISVVVVNGKFASVHIPMTVVWENSQIHVVY